MTATAAETIIDRVEGRRPSRSRALLLACAAAAGAGVMVYKLLRSGE